MQKAISINKDGAAKSLLKRAVELDKFKIYKEALVYYKEGIKLLLEVIADIEDKEINLKYGEKALEYMERAEKLDALIRNEIEPRKNTLFTVMTYLTYRKLLLVLMIVSLTWNWIRLYKIQWASKFAIVLSSGGIPPECYPQDMTWTQSLRYILRSFVSTVDRCQEYHEALMVDPLYEVNPLTAAVDLATNLLLYPLSRMGGETGAMFSSLLSPVPLFWKAPVFLAFLMLIWFLMILLAGYRIRLPLLFGVLEPSNDNQQDIVEEMKEIKKKFKIQMEKECCIGVQK